jgi:transcriptional regulator with XRE-family HTH domain
VSPPALDLIESGRVEVKVERLDKAVIGQRIKHLRKARALRQWQMAELLGATQPAVHKYENGILPEVRRLLEIARIGNTTIEWILTGRHCENGSKDMDRLPAEIYDLAYQLRGFTPEDRRILSEAIELIGAAAAAVRESARRDAPEMTDAEIGRSVRAFERHAREALQAALAIHDAVVTTLSDGKVRDLHRFGQAPGETPIEGPVGVPSLQKNAG